MYMYVWVCSVCIICGRHRVLSVECYCELRSSVVLFVDIASHLVGRGYSPSYVMGYDPKPRVDKPCQLCHIQDSKISQRSSENLCSESDTHTVLRSVESKETCLVIPPRIVC